ncbi:MAG: coenzyme F420-reducing hydrogenase, FrhD protein [Methanobrevibacter wolinii]|uniref:coenzyme F420-reducing hydrogenase, FrhD protein n=1 Tax=Methanobrevibacter wolinii TaxID=190977 RepID=UPI0005B26AD9|nr:coenzyme F420-reducing hydrogenase, FrhD protein [Methanobrevibacter wolinii]MDD5960557.1 coenzyme F420-reducing hydrogenase, FrhD protein [Methanobrevibacter wolinii]
MTYDVGTIVVGCGNVLFKDDGFGPHVIKTIKEEYLKDNECPDDVEFIDAGTSATYYIFSLPSDAWKKIIVVDVVDYHAEPGSLKYFSPFEMPKGKYENAHNWAVEEPLQDLANKGIDVVIVGCQPQEISAPDIDLGLSESVQNAIPKAIDMIFKEIGVN